MEEFDFLDEVNKLFYKVYSFIVGYYHDTIYKNIQEFIFI
jgi:hypothetical protein